MSALGAAWTPCYSQEQSFLDSRILLFLLELELSNCFEDTMLVIV